MVPDDGSSERQDGTEPEDDDDSDATAALQLQKGEDLLQRHGSPSQKRFTRSTPTSPASGSPPSLDDSSVPGRVDDLGSLGVVSLEQGDIFTIGQLLRAANVSLDKRRHNVPAWVGGSYRSSGFVLVIRIHYTNLESWLGLKVLPWRMLGPRMHYTHRITKHASHDDFMLRQVYAPTAKDPPNARVVKEYHGIRVLVEQSGTVALWNNIQLLLIITTTLALMTLFTCITDSVMMYCLPQSDEYFAIKYERPRAKKPQRKNSKDNIAG